LAPSTLQLYQRGYSQFIEFRNLYNLSNIWPIPVCDIIHFLAYLFQKKMSYSSISSYLSGLAFYSKIYGFGNCTQNFLIRKTLEGIKRAKGNGSDSHLPITSLLLSKILTVLPAVCISGYETLLFKAAFTMTFFWTVKSI